MSASVPRPPAIPLARRYYVLAAASAVGGGLSLVALSGLASLAVLFLYLAGLFLLLGRVVGRDAWGSAYVAAALQALTRGRFDEVEELHARVPASSMKRGTVARAVAVQKALVALYRGSAEGAIAAIEPALAPRVRVYSRSYERMQMASAYGVRAFAHAMRGDGARAEADAAAAESIAEAMPDALARGRLARAMMIARGGDMIALSSALAKDSSLVLEYAMPRERALVRALRKMAHGRGRSVYREPSKPTDGNEPGALASWIAQVAPDAAAYASDEVALAETTAEVKAPQLTPAARKAVAVADGEAKKSAQAASGKRAAPVAKVLAVFFGLVLGATALITLLFQAGSTAGGEAAASAGTPFEPVTLLSYTMLAGLTLLVFRQLEKTSELNLALIGAQRAAALGDSVAAEALAATGKKSTMTIFVSAAGATIASIAERRGEFTRAVAECDAAMLPLRKNPRRVVQAEAVLPTLLGIRGVSLAALGRSDEAESELAALVSTYPTYSYVPHFDFRIRLLNAVRAGDLEKARAVALRRTAELPVPLRDDLLADLVLATTGSGISKEEMERVDAELRDAREVATWVEAVAPGLRERFSGVAHGRPRVASHIDAAPEVRDPMDVSLVYETGEEEEETAAQERIEAHG